MKRLNDLLALAVLAVAIATPAMAADIAAIFLTQIGCEDNEINFYQTDPDQYLFYF